MKVVKLFWLVSAGTRIGGLTCLRPSRRSTNIITNKSPQHKRPSKTNKLPTKSLNHRSQYPPQTTRSSLYKKIKQTHQNILA